MAVAAGIGYEVPQLINGDGSLQENVLKLRTTSLLIISYQTEGQTCVHECPDSKHWGCKMGVHVNVLAQWWRLQTLRRVLPMAFGCRLPTVEMLSRCDPKD